MIPRDDQIALAVQGYHVLREHMIVYLAGEERVGKSLTAILIAEMCANVERILVITKKQPLKGWNELFEQYNSFKKFSGSTYHSAHKLDPADYDLIILDESHNYISSYPKPNTIHKKIARLTKGKPLIFSSATPHPQGYQQLYHQFALSAWSPWKKYKNFYEWFKTYGIETYVYIDGIERQQYNNTNEILVKGVVEHLFVTRTRKESGFKFEPKDKIHYVQLSADTMSWYNTMIKDLVVEISPGTKIMCDTAAKLRFALHMLEGGVAKGVRSYFTLPNTEKIEYILENWGDVESLVFF